jgi:glycopeptide antibiotics resistance protein
MRTAVKKLLVIAPVVLLGLFYLRSHYAVFARNVGEGRVLLMWLSFFILYAWVFLTTIRKKQDSIVFVGIQASFFVYIFMVLTLTGYFILFREISVHHWYDKMMQRVETKDHVNLELFKIFSIYEFSNKQVLGNFVMLLPLGIYLPVLYRRMSNFFKVVLVCMLVSVIIELMQLITKYRSADVDDVLLNTIGACIGYGLYRMFRGAGKELRPADKLNRRFAGSPGLPGSGITD